MGKLEEGGVSIRSIVVRKEMKNEVWSSIDDCNAGSLTRVDMKQRRAPTRLERRGMLYPLARSWRSETTPGRRVERRGFPYPHCRRETVHGSRGDDDAGSCTRSHDPQA
ncbi:hypothetical protein F2Q69_00014871 [Brassica cretica]|uniref:Uncharacterized protein n=1 Tax=Brassica cretica TaxID=69181 RepID=A0A8S9QPJ8_BRACR|nr:hypothetical protein F2Q69_00014871 [Brassica cretica]